jgi:hypothetical protein
MFALDLFNTDHERRLTEGAVDTLEQRRIDDLAMKMDDLVARAKEPAYKKNPAALAALMKEFQKCKDERDSYYKIREAVCSECGMSEGQCGHTNEAGIPGNIPVEKIPGKEDLLKGKGRSYYEGAEDYAEIYSPEAIALGKKFCEHYNITDDTDVQLAVEIIDSYIDEFKATNTPIDLKKIRSGVADAFRQVYRGMGPGPSFRKKFQEAQKKSPETNPLDQKLQRLKTQARRQFPRAHSDEEALLLKLLDKETQNDLANRRTDARQDTDLKQNFAFDQEQEDEIQDLQAQTGIKEHGGGIGPRQHWQDLMQERKLSPGDPVVVTGPNKFEGKTGEISEFSPSGKFVVVNLYNHGEHSMHLSDVTYNEYADQDEDDWYDEDQVEEDQGAGQVAVKAADDAVVNTMGEGWSDAMLARRTGQPRTPYSVYIKGKKWKDFANDDHARAVMDKLKAKFKAEGRDPSVITIAPTDMSEEEQKPEFGQFPPKQEITIVPPKKLKSGETYQDRNKYWQSQGQAPIYKTNEDTDQAKRVFKDKAGRPVGEIGIDPESSPGNGEWYVHHYATGYSVVGFDSAAEAKRELMYVHKHPDSVEGHPSTTEQGVAEAGTDYSKRRQRERDVDSGKPVARQRQPRMTDYQRRRAQDKKDMELGEASGGNYEQMNYRNSPTDPYVVYDRTMKAVILTTDSLEQAKQEAIEWAEYDDIDVSVISRATKKSIFRVNGYAGAEKYLNEEQDTSGVERAILNRIMVAHTDLLMKFGPEKVMQAAEEVAYNVGDVDEIGTSDVSAYVNQVKQILGVV